jgi:hypothetical protein
MPHRSIRRRVLFVCLPLAFAFAPARAQMKGPTASAPATRPAERVLNGTLKSIDPATGEVKLIWRHSRQRGELEFLAWLDAHAQVTVNGKPATLSDAKPGDRVTFTGQAKPVGHNLRFTISRMDVHRQPASRPSGAETAEGVLDRLDRKGHELHDIQAKITFTRNDPVRQDKQVHQGILRFKDGKPNPRFFIRFDKLAQEGATRADPEWYVFDGQWSVEAREKTKTMVRRQVVRPGEPVSVFFLGEAPFPLPFGQKKSQIEKLFDVRLTPSRPNDPPNSVRLECTPKAGTNLENKYGRIDLCVDKQLDLPVRVSAIEKPINIEITADFPARSIEINQGLPGGKLDLPELKDYKVETTK